MNNCRKTPNFNIIIRIFQGNYISLQIFIIAMIILNYILQNCNVGYKFTGSHEKLTILCYEKREMMEFEILIQTEFSVRMP